MTAKKSYVCRLEPEQVAELRALMEPNGWQFDDVAYAHWRGRLDKTTVVAYLSGKMTVQGGGTPDFVQFLLEPEILREVRYGYENILVEQENPRMFEPHAGIDESGKGDYFGPLVIAAVYVDAASARQLTSMGVTDSKAIKNDKRIAELSDKIRVVVNGKFSIVPIGPDAYNRLYDKFRNVNRLLAWGHAKALENVLERVPDCSRAISDQFGRKETVLRALQERGRKIVLEQRPRAESDIAVAAASILARAEFVRRLEALGRDMAITLPKGAGDRVLEVGRGIVAEGRRNILPRVAKMHFKTTQKLTDSGESFPVA